MSENKIIFSDNLEAIRKMGDNSIDAIITDSPYGLGKEPDAVKCLQDWIDHGYHEVKGKGFMGKDWDAFVPQPVLWKECYRVLKPGGHLLSFFGTRTYDWGTLSIRLAGFEIRDCIMWIYGSGFPKSLDVSKAIDKAAGAERKIVGSKKLWGHNAGSGAGSFAKNEYEGLTGVTRTENITEPATDDAKKWEGYGTALKPACEPICVARKPIEGTVIENVQKWGTGAMDINSGRVETEERRPLRIVADFNEEVEYNGNSLAGRVDGSLKTSKAVGNTNVGRWPANIIHDGSDEVLQCFPDAPGQQAALTGKEPTANGFSGNVSYSGMKKRVDFPEPRNDLGSAARFFYCAKVSPAERLGRKHPTIKPLELMEYLVKIFCPKNGVVLDPHFGSGTTGGACINTNRYFIGIDNDEKSIEESKEFIKSFGFYL